MIKGVFNNRPTKPKYIFIWDVQRVLDFIKVKCSDNKNFCQRNIIDIDYVEAKIHIHFKMALFNDRFFNEKKCVQIHYSLKNEILNKVIHSKHGL